MLDPKKQKIIDELVKHFISQQEIFSFALDSIHSFVASSKLKPLIHSVKSRIKDPEHLRDKLVRIDSQLAEKGEPFDITKDNLFQRVHDLGGFRIIHLHTKQIEKIDTHLKQILLDNEWEIFKGPNARTWDDESRQYFESVGIETSKNSNMYTSVHYIIKPNSKITCEIQVRTLMEEVWGEVDHTINYPHKTDSLSCREQIKALARATSSCSRLVDSIFATHKDFEETKKILIPIKKVRKKN